MAVYTIIRVYEVPADNQQQATDRMLEALVLHVERDYHVKDVIRAPGAKPGQGKRGRVNNSERALRLRKVVGLDGDD